MVESTPVSPPPGFGPACAAIARAITRSVEPAEVIDRIAAASRLVIPFDAMGVWHAESPDDPVALTLGPGIAIGESPPTRPLRRADHSPRLWPDGDARPVCIGDAPHQLDVAYAGDRYLVEHGYRSAMVLFLGGGTQECLWFVHRDRNVFTEAHARALEPVIDLVTLGAEHLRLRAVTRERRRKRDALEALLPTLARALDVKSVISQISDVIQAVLPHDHLRVGLLTEDGRGFKLHASSLGSVAEAPEYRPASPFWQETKDWEVFIVRDFTPISEDTVRALVWDPGERRVVTTEFQPDPYFLRALTESKVRSQLRLPVWLQGERLGYLFVMARRPNAYGEEDAELGRRVADHIALAISHERLAEEVRRAAQAQHHAAQLQDRVDALVEELEGITPHRALGRSAKWRDILADATKVAQTDATVLITGESGTGKEVVARFIHRGSRRAKGAFVALNCAALPQDLLEAELFGYERGAFTGAQAARAGRLEQAAGGTLFLDEVAEMTPPVQAKFLRVLQEREFQRLGGSATLRADVRVIAATNRDPVVAMERGALREDLYYRLNVFEMTLPPLRERPDDIPVLAEAFLEEIGRSIGHPSAGLSKDARDRLLAHSWPGNVRELRNALERAVILCEGGLITGEHLPIAVAGAPRPRPGAAAAPHGRTPEGPAASAAPGAPAIPKATTAPLAAGAPTTRAGSVAPAGSPVSLEAMERELIAKAMAQAGNNKSEAARLLGLGRGQLYSRLRRLGLTRAKR